MTGGTAPVPLRLHELQLRRDIALHELRCLAEDQPGQVAEISLLIEEIKVLDARYDGLARVISSARLPGCPPA